MYKVYVLYSGNFNKIYIGCTSNLIKRLISHNESCIKDRTRSFCSFLKGANLTCGSLYFR
ncbi:MAG: GIY-YIG nuclease family protein [Bacteroidales bacterium]|nr:GIY-YIG nuclease family protein [Bacteroidales bacterium]MCB8999213.1 GIY-YIG nuclease family protein [Bacteroidales bacterium]